MKTAILQVADTGPLESLVAMLSLCGYQCYLPDRGLKNVLRNLGCDTVLDIENLVRQWGYEYPKSLPEANAGMMKTVDLFVDIKAQKNYDRVTKYWPGLKGKVLWYRINGGEPQHVINHRGDHGNEMNPPCPILTPNQWYRETYLRCMRCKGYGETLPGKTCCECHGKGSRRSPWANHPGYVCWPPFVRKEEYAHERIGWEDGRVRGQTNVVYENPICLVHNLIGWGYGALVKGMQDLGVRMHGVGAPDGLIRHERIAVRLQKAVAMVHLKDSDAPGYAMYEALASGCPLIVPKSMIWKNRMQELLIPDETCLTFHRETHESMTEQEVRDSIKKIKEHLTNLRNPAYNHHIGENGRKKLTEVMWREDRDLESLQEFFRRNYP